MVVVKFGTLQRRHLYQSVGVWGIR